MLGATGMTRVDEHLPHETVDHSAAGQPDTLGPVLRVRRWFSRRSGPVGSSLAALVIVGALVLLPIGFVTLNSFNQSRPGSPSDFGISNWLRAFDEPSLWLAIWNTVSLGVTRTLVALVVGTSIAWLLARSDIPFAGPLEFSFWLAFFLPSLPLTFGWIGLLDPLYGVVNVWLRSLPGMGGSVTGPFDIYSFWGINWVHLTSMTIPFVVIMLVPGFRNMGGMLEEAARMCGATRLRAISRISIPLMLPAILAALMLSFIRSLQAFEVELVLGAPIGLEVYSTRIYRWIAFEPPEYGMATALGSAFMVLMICLAIIHRKVVRGRSFTTIGGHSFSRQPVPLGRAGRWLAFLACASFLVLGVGAPLAFMIVGSLMTRFGFFSLADPFTTDHWSRTLTDSVFVGATWNTLVIGVGSAIIGLALYWWIGHVVVRAKSRTAGPIDLMAWMPLAVPGVLLGLGFLWLFLSSPLRVVLFGTVFGLMIAIVVGHMPTGVQQLKASLMQVTAELDEAAAISGAGPLMRTRKITLPLLTPTLVAAGMLTFATAVRDISTVVLVSSHNSRPLSLLMLEYSTAGAMERAAVVGVLITLVMALIAIIARTLGNRGFHRRRGHGSGGGASPGDQ